MSPSTLQVPEVALQWILQYSCTSNLDLARFSNVNRFWRSVAYELLKDILTKVLQKELQDPIYQNVMKTPSGPIVNKLMMDMSDFRTLSSLLLPDMAIEIVRTSLQKCTKSIANSSKDRCVSAFGSSTDFCLAWFHPKGIKIQTVNLAEEEEEISSTSSSDDSSSDEEWDYEEEVDRRNSSGKSKVNGLYHHPKIPLCSLRLRHLQSDKSKQQLEEKSQLKTCSYEWQGYRHATEVLKPFGYSTSFIRVSAQGR